MGKLADLVVLTANPMKVDAATIKNIKVAETIKQGKSVFKRATSPTARPVSEEELVLTC